MLMQLLQGCVIGSASFSVSLMAGSHVCQSSCSSCTWGEDGEAGPWPEFLDMLAANSAGLIAVVQNRHWGYKGGEGSGGQGA